MAPRPTKKSPGSTTPQPPPRPDLPVQARHPPPPGLPATAPRPTAVVGRVAELMGGKAPTLEVLDGVGLGQVAAVRPHRARGAERLRHRDAGPLRALDQRLRPPAHPPGRGAPEPREDDV